MQQTLASATLALAALALVAPVAAADPSITRVHIVSQHGSSTADDGPKYARLGEPVTLFAVLEVLDHRGSNRRTFYSDAPWLQLGGRRVAAKPMREAPAHRLSWKKIEPTERTMSNTASGSFRFEAIAYAVTDLASTGAAIAADVHPTLTSDYGDGVGTMRYQLVVEQGGRTVSSPGIEARRGRGSGGLSDAVHRVSIRRDDSYLGYLTEMFGQPYIWASAGTADGAHQSERLEGSDCADFVVYGWRRLGHRVPYTWTGGLPKLTTTLGAGVRRGDTYVDAGGKPVRFPKPGDLMLFPRHVGVLVADRGTPGVVDVHDLIAHTLFDSPRIVAVADSGYADNPIQILRWK